MNVDNIKKIEDTLLLPYVKKNKPQKPNNILAYVSLVTIRILWNEGQPISKSPITLESIPALSKIITKYI